MLFDCQCGAEITTSNVVRSGDLREAPGFIFVITLCWSCGHEQSTAIHFAKWNNIMAEAEAMQRELESSSISFHASMESIVTANDLLRAFAHSGPPPAELAACACYTCERHRG